MEKTLIKTTLLKEVSLALGGCAFITLCSLLKIPFYPVPFTMQTFALFILALTMPPRRALSAVAVYLLFASLGLPVLCGAANPLWITGKCGGYLLAFPFSVYLMAWLKMQKWNPFLALLMGQFLIFSMGFLWLIPFFGWKIALMQGVVFFIPSALLKNLMAIGFYRMGRKIYAP